MSGAPNTDEAIRYQSCSKCSHRWYFRRAFCPQCGATDPKTCDASGEGIVYAATLVCRAATPETKSYVPYAILLVDIAEGFRMMAHGDEALKIGDTVVADYRDFAGRRVPHFIKG